MPEPPRTYSGGCHCGAVRFRVRTAARVIRECNCSVCTKKGYLHLIVSKDEFELLSGQEALVDYQWGTRTAHHLFCGTCGVHSFYVPRSHPDGYSVNVRCLDGAPLQDFDLQPFDGQNWEASVGAIR